MAALVIYYTSWQRRPGDRLYGGYISILDLLPCSNFVPSPKQSDKHKPAASSVPSSNTKIRGNAESIAGRRGRGRGRRRGGRALLDADEPRGRPRHLLRERLELWQLVHVEQVRGVVVLLEDLPDRALD